MSSLFVRYLRLLFAGAAVLLFLLAFAVPVEGQQHKVIVANMEGIINPPMANYLKRVIERANSENAVAVVLLTDTPGGLDTSMREIIKAILDSQVPVILYVVPGGRAASAGTFIAMASHVAAMAPTTSIGAASPVGSQGGDIGGTLEKKVTNDAAEYIRGLAKLRGRNDEWAAEKAVRNAESLDAEAALEQNVIDFVSPDLDSLLETLDGQVIQLNEATRIRLNLKDAQVVNDDMSLIERILFVISDPNLAFLLLSLGSLGLFFEFANPGTFFPGVVGGIALLLGLYGVGTLGANWVGVAFMGLAFILFIAELLTSGIGILGAGAVASFVLGSFMLWGGSPGISLQVNKWLIGAVSGGVSLFFIFVMQIVWRSQRLAPVSGTAGLLGMTGVARTSLSPEGAVLLNGEIWRARLEGGGSVSEGEEVRVESVEGLTLRVTKKTIK